MLYIDGDGLGKYYCLLKCNRLVDDTAFLEDYKTCDFSSDG
jgi:hypothetical protein